MTTIPAGVASQQALLRQNVALETIRQGFEQQQQLVEVIEESVNVNATRGSNVNIQV